MARNNVMRRNLISFPKLVPTRNKATAVAAVVANAEESFQKEWKNAKPFESIPGRKPLPFIGTTYEVFMRFSPPPYKFPRFPFDDVQLRQEVDGALRLFFGQDFDKDRMHLTHKNYAEKYGSLYKFEFMGIPPIVMVCEPSEIESVFRADGKFPERPTFETLKYYREKRIEMFEHTGLLIMNGEAWWKFRSKVQQPLMKPENMLKYLSVMEGVSQEMVDRIRTIRDANNETPENFLNEMFKWALESVALVALDVRFGSLRGELEPGSEPQKMIDATLVTFQALQELELGRAPFWKWLPSRTLNKMFEAQDVFVETSMKYINQAFERSAKKDEESEKTILEAIIARGSTAKDAVVMVLDMLMAGIDTTSSTQSFVFYHLARNPDKQEKLREEIRRLIPNPDTPITAEILAQMRYLKCCVKESLRLSPATIGSARVSNKDLVVGGYQVPKGIMLAMPNQYISTLEEHYKRATQFIPERWIKGHEMEAVGHPYTTLPFGFGPRMCIGRRIAEQEMWLLTVKVLQQMRIEWHHGELDYVTRAINTPDKPLKFRFIDL